METESVTELFAINSVIAKSGSCFFQSSFGNILKSDGHSLTWRIG